MGEKKHSKFSLQKPIRKLYFHFPVPIFILEEERIILWIQIRLSENYTLGITSLTSAGRQTCKHNLRASDKGWEPTKP